MSKGPEAGEPRHLRLEQGTQRGCTGEQNEQKALNDKPGPQNPSSAEGPLAPELPAFTRKPFLGGQAVGRASAGDAASCVSYLYLIPTPIKPPEVPPSHTCGHLSGNSGGGQWWCQLQLRSRGHGGKPSARWWVQALGAW